ncbi:MAG TPA: holo-[acyl-carrier-protein] synthase [Oceanithermus profundus]|uniref:Holo-[acyl-carrier-protein] synthase n=1 Tax=Oceanithermus profundus TaxID=187137 RepID=A0A7C4ZAG4_9DEIN|nr:holo-[acyl-carrier-protein] synthase [Oceanithermus profundus]
MIVAIGSDLVSVERVRGVYARHPERFLSRHFTPEEQAYALAAADPAPRLAVRWAAKEAFAKVWGEPLGWRDVAVTHDGRGSPQLRFSAGLERALAERGLAALVTLSHERDYALAFVALVTQPSPRTP